MKGCLAPEYVSVTNPSPYSVEAVDTKDGAMDSGRVRQQETMVRAVQGKVHTASV